MEVYKDIMSDTEYFSNAKPIKPVTDGKEEEKVDGLVYVETSKVAVGGDAIDVGCGDAFGGAGEDEGVDDTVETVIDQLAAFPDINPEPVSYSSFKEFRDVYFKGYMKALQGFKKMKGHFATKEDQTAFQERMKGIMEWIKANFGEIDFYQAAVPLATIVLDDGTEKEVPTSMVYARWEGAATTPKFCYIMDAYRMEKF